MIFTDCGDFMWILSDGEFPSPLHRVLLLPTKDEDVNIVYRRISPRDTVMINP